MCLEVWGLGAEIRAQAHQSSSLWELVGGPGSSGPQQSEVSDQEDQEDGRKADLAVDSGRGRKVEHSPALRELSPHCAWTCWWSLASFAECWRWSRADCEA